MTWRCNAVMMLFVPSPFTLRVAVGGAINWRVTPRRRCKRVRVDNGEQRVLRGGSWINNARNTRSANRNANDPANRSNNTGFRLALAQWCGGCYAKDQTLILSRRSVGKKPMAAGVLVADADAPRKLAGWSPISRAQPRPAG